MKTYQPQASGGNATVPSDAPILPAQAFVDAIPRLIASFSTAIIDLSNLGITQSDESDDLTTQPIVATALLLANSGNPAAINLSGNKLRLQSVDAILKHFGRDNSFSIQSLDFTGANMATPTKPVFVIDFNNLDEAGIAVQNYGSGFVSAATLINFDVSRAFSGTTVNFVEASADSEGAFIRVGIIDAPTKQQIITKLVSLGAGKIVDNGDLTITVSPSNYDLEPLDFTGMTGSSLTQGNNDIGTLRANGATVLTN